MAEYNREYASKGVAGAGLGLGIAGTALALGNGALNWGGWNNGWGRNGCNCNGWNGWNGDCGVNRYELTQSEVISQKDMEIAYYRGQNTVDAKLLEMYKYIDGKLKAIDDRFEAQAVLNEQTACSVRLLSQQQCQMKSLLDDILITRVNSEMLCPPISTTPATTAARVAASAAKV